MTLFRHAETHSLLNINNGDIVLIVIIQVLAGHTPDEGIVVGTCGSMDAPFGRHDGLLVVQPYHTAFLRLPHDVRDSLILRQVEVIIGLDTATVKMRRHCIPCSTRIQLRQTKLQLARALLQHVVDDKLINGTVVALFQRTYRSPNGSLERAFTSVESNPLGLLVFVSSCRIQIELSGLRSIL